MKLINLTKIILPIFLTTYVVNAMSFSKNQNYMGYNLIYATGHIRHGDLNRLKREYYSLNHKKQTIVVFNSYGGELYEGIQIGRFLKRNHIGSAVRRNGICASSCAISFLGGTSKNGNSLMILPYTSNLGFHSFYYKNGNYVKLSKVQEDLANILSYASYVNAPHYLMANMFRTKSNKMYWITPQDRVVLGLQSNLTLNKNRYLSSNHTTYSKSVTSYIKEYFSKINNMVISSKGSSIYSKDKALSSIKYKNWMSRHVKYIYLKRVKKLDSNTVEAKVIYALNNGIRICSVNRYDIITQNNSFNVIKKYYKGCNRTSAKHLRKLAKALP